MSPNAVQYPNVLVVDDDKRNLRVMEKVLSGMPLTIHTVENGEKALSLLLRHNFALILLDVQMPGMSGYEVASIIRGDDSLKEIPIIFVTAISKEDESVFEGYEKGAVDYLFKPLKPIIIRSKVAIFLELFNQKKQLLEEKQKAEFATRAKSDFLSSMSHEIRTPLNAILGIGDILLENPRDQEQERHIQLLCRAGDTLLEMINDVLDLSKIEAGQTHLEMIDFDLRKCIEDTTSFLAVRARKNNLELVLDIPNNIPEWVNGDPTRVKQILLNLVGNAIKFTQKGGISVSVRNTEKNDILFSVKDSGIGIPESKCADIFDRFSQAEDSTTRWFGGTGLGLSICKKLVEMMNGTIGVTSQLGKGSTFFFSIPFGASKQNELSLVDNFQLNGVTALVVDDYDDERKIIEEMLNELGVAVSSVQSGHDAISLGEKIRDFNILFIDSRMPDIGGLDIVERLFPFNIGKSTIMILPPGHRRGDLVRMRDLGIQHYVNAPIKRAELNQAVFNTLNIKDPFQKDGTQSANRNSKRKKSEALKPMNILVVEDSEDSRMLFEVYIKGLPYQLTAAEDGKEGFEKYKAGNFDIVFMDMFMPVMGGVEATQLIRNWESVNAKKPVPIIAFSASIVEEDLIKLREAGCNSELTKPVKKKVFLQKIKEYSKISNNEKETKSAA